MRSFIPYVAILSITSACGLVKVNGKGLGGGGTSSGSGGSSEAEPAAERGPDDDFESREDYEARQQRTYDEQEKKSAADKAGQPAVCGDYGISNSRDIELEDFADLETSKRDWKYSAKDFAEVMCSTRGKNLELRPKVMALRDKWMKQHGLDEDDFVVVLVEGMGRGWENQSYGAFPGPVSQLAHAPVALDELDRYGSRASMLARANFVGRCLQSVSDRNVLHTIQCTSEPLDAARGLAEIEATPGLNIQSRFHLRQLVHDTVLEQAAARTELAKRAKGEPGITKLIAIADAQHKEWAAPSPARAKLIQLVETMEAATDAKKRSAFAGCDATTHAAWSDVVKAADLPAVTETDVLATMVGALFKSPEAYLAYWALELCANGVDAGFAPEFDMLGSAYLRRGPRSSAIAAWMAAAGEIEFDSKDLEMANLIRELGTRQGYWGKRVTVGVIDEVVAKDGSVEISFKKDIIEVQECVAWRQTRRIRKIDTDGTVYYEQVCTKIGPVKSDRTPEDVTISGFVAQGLKPGMLFMVTEDRFPIVATASSKSTKAAWLFGVAR